MQNQMFRRVRIAEPHRLPDVAHLHDHAPRDALAHDGHAGERAGLRVDLSLDGAEVCGRECDGEQDDLRVGPVLGLRE